MIFRDFAWSLMTRLRLGRHELDWIGLTREEESLSILLLCLKHRRFEQDIRMFWWLPARLHDGFNLGGHHAQNFQLDAIELVKTPPKATHASEGGLVNKRQRTN